MQRPQGGRGRRASTEARATTRGYPTKGDSSGTRKLRAADPKGRTRCRPATLTARQRTSAKRKTWSSHTEPRYTCPTAALEYLRRKPSRAVLVVLITLSTLLALCAAQCVMTWLRGGKGKAPVWHPWVERSLVLFMFVLLPAHWVYSEHWYGNYIRPTGIADVAGYYARYGEPRRIRVLQRDGATYYHLHGHLPPSYIMALPSEPAAYVFDSSGKFISWCSDTGDGAGEAYWRNWPRDAGVDLSSVELKARLAR